METVRNLGILDLDAVRSVHMADIPYRWGLIQHAFRNLELAHTLEVEFPTTGFILTHRPSGIAGQKGYHTHNLSLVAAGNSVAESLRHLTPLWRQMLTELRSAAYRQAVSTLIGRSLERSRLEIRAIRYGPGSWLDPHTDRADKAVTQTWYFNTRWCASWQGALRILRSRNDTDVVADIVPSLGQSVVLIPSEHSWHSVPRVSNDAPEDRRTLLAHFLEPA